MSTMITGRVTSTAESRNSGAWNCGTPIQAASRMCSAASGPIAPVRAAKTQPMITPMRMPRRATMPRPATVATRMASSVTPATQGCDWKLSAAVGARFRPIRATIAPVTAGGITASMTRLPAALTMKPTQASAAPVTTMPPSWTAMPSAWVAVSGAMKAKELPR